MIRKVELSDAARICEILNYYVEHTAITFNTEPFTEAQMLHKIEHLLSSGYPFYVYEQEGVIEGYYYLSEWKPREAYKISAELSIYVNHKHLRSGFGAKMMRHLLNNVDREQFHSIIACITLPNEPSVALHERFGFEKVSFFREVGLKFGNLCNVGDWQLVL